MASINLKLHATRGTAPAAIFIAGRRWQSFPRKFWGFFRYMPTIARLPKPDNRSR